MKGFGPQSFISWERQQAQTGVAASKPRLLVSVSATNKPSQDSTALFHCFILHTDSVAQESKQAP